MAKSHIVADKAPSPIGPYVHAVVENYRYRCEVFGQSGRNHISGKLADGVEAQTEVALRNIESILSEIGWGLDNIIKVRAYSTDIKNYADVNRFYTNIVGEELPARAVVVVSALPGGALIEMECVAGGDKITIPR